MKYTGPLGKGFHGDREKAMTLMGQARLLVQELISAIQRPPWNGTGYLHRKMRLLDGSEIHAQVNHINGKGVERVWIEAPRVIASAREIETPKARYTLYSGFFEGRNFTWEADGYFRRVQFLDKEKSGAVVSRWIRRDWENTDKLGPSIAGTDNPCGPADDFAIVRNGYAGQYSGEMRKVVQLLLGLVVNEGGNKVSKPILYRPCAARTHGIFVASNGSRWVIECDDASGITAWALPVIEGAKPNPEDGIDIPYYPLPIDELPSLESRVTLLSPESYAAYTDYDPMSPLIGWAFSKSGHKAINVALDFDELGYYMTRLCRLSIAEADGAPVSAALTIGDPKYLHGAYDSLTLIKTPRYMGVDGATVGWWPISQSWIPGEMPSGIYGDVAPVHAFFIGESEVILSHRNVWGNYPAQLGIIDVQGGKRPSGFATSNTPNMVPFESLVIPFREREAYYLYVGNVVIPTPPSDQFSSYEHLTFFYDGELHTIFEEARSAAGGTDEAIDVVYAVTLDPFVFRPGLGPAPNQWIDAAIDVFSGAGTIGNDMDATGGEYRYYLRKADTLYKCRETQTPSVGWFGAPFPEYSGVGGLNAPVS